VPAVRVLIAVDPFLYGEVLAFSLRKQRPRAEVTLLAPSGEHLLAAELERVCEQARPHLVVANRVPPRPRRARSGSRSPFRADRSPSARR
jgi:hypothetical protein